MRETLKDFADERNMLEFHDDLWWASLVSAATKDNAITKLCESIGVLKDKEYEGC